MLRKKQRWQQTVNQRRPSPQPQQQQDFLRRPQEVVFISPSAPPPPKRQDTVLPQQVVSVLPSSSSQQQNRQQTAFQQLPQRQEMVSVLPSSSQQRNCQPTAAAALQQQPQRKQVVSAVLPSSSQQRNCQQTAALQQQPQRKQVVSAVLPSSSQQQNCQQTAALQQQPQRKQVVDVKSSSMAASSVSLLECPVCMETMCAPILQCKKGHSLCNTCTTALRDGLCPICRDLMTGMRNFSLEQVVAEVKLECPNKPCIFKIKRSEMDAHQKECIYRPMSCPLGVANGKCSWTGSTKEMLAHFKERHPGSRVNLDEDFKLNNVKVDEDERLVFLTNHGNFLFTITLRIDTLQKMCYFVIQHIGTRNTAHSFFYEIQISSQVDSRRQILFKNNCFSDVMKADEVYQLGECAMLPLSLLPHFLKNEMFSFRLSLARQGGPNNHRFQDPRPSSSNSPHHPSGPRERGNNFKPRGRPHNRGHPGTQPKKSANE